MKERRGIIPLLLLSFVVSAAVLWPLPLSPDPHDHSDTLFNTWLTSWNHHAMTAFSNPLNTPQFAGFPDGRGRSDLLLTQWLFSLPLRAFTGNPIRIHNLLMWISLSLTGLAAGFLARDRGASGWGAAFASTAFVSLPYFQSHLWHLQLSSVGLTLAGIMFALRTVEGRGGGKLLALLIPLQGLASLYHWYFLNLALLVILVRTLFTADRAKIGGLLLTPRWAMRSCFHSFCRSWITQPRWDVDTIARHRCFGLCKPLAHKLPDGLAQNPPRPSRGCALARSFRPRGRRLGNLSKERRRKLGASDTWCLLRRVQPRSHDHHLGQGNRPRAFPIDRRPAGRNGCQASGKGRLPGPASPDCRGGTAIGAQALPSDRRRWSSHSPRQPTRPSRPSVSTFRRITNGSPDSTRKGCFTSRSQRSSDGPKKKLSA
ncbi:MAG: hypothetical protein MZU95_02875 [Desulfomicrobium escambiense]|nr:hypothetical protein [Desulfomicrobium escambiense]